MSKSSFLDIEEHGFSDSLHFSLVHYLFFFSSLTSDGFSQLPLLFGARECEKRRKRDGKILLFFVLCYFGDVVLSLIIMIFIV